MGTFDDNAPLPDPEDILKSSNEANRSIPDPTADHSNVSRAEVGLGEAEKPMEFEAPAFDAPINSLNQSSTDDFEDMRVPGAEPAPAPVDRKKKRGPVRAYVPVVLHPTVQATDTELRLRTDRDSDSGILLAPSTPDDISNILAAIDGNELETTVETREWLQQLDESTMISPQSDIILRATVRPGSVWAQQLTGKHIYVKPAYKRVDASLVKPEVTGNNAVDMFIAGTGMGRTVRWPLYRTGIWINIRPASLTYLAEIDRSLSFDRAQLGMDTSGLVNSNDDMIFEEKLFDAALRLITWTNVEVSSAMDLRDIIVRSDIQSLIAAMSAATYADGATGSIPCTEHNCRQLDTFEMDIRRMSWVDQSRFSQQQIDFMDDIDTVHTREQVREYQNTFLKSEEGSHNYKGRIFDFHVGTAGQYFQNAHAWFAQINRALNEALGEEDIDNGKRARVTQSILTAETLCRYLHYIKSIRIPGKDDQQNDVISTISDQATIRDILRMLISDDDGADALLAAIDDYIVQTEVVVIGYRNVKCSACGTYHLDDRGEARLIIPFKVGTAFFTQLQLRLLRTGVTPLTDLTMSGIRAFARMVSDSELESLSTPAMPMAQ